MTDERDDMFANFDPDAETEATPTAPPPSKPKGKVRKRETQDQLNVLIRKGNAKRFRLKALNEDTTMSALIDKWVAEYLRGER